MIHEDFPVAGFEFMNEPATPVQKDIIVDLSAKVGTPISRDGRWPIPFSKWDAKLMIDALTAVFEKRSASGDGSQK